MEDILEELEEKGYMQDIKDIEEDRIIVDSNENPEELRQELQNLRPRYPETRKYGNTTQMDAELTGVAGALLGGIGIVSLLEGNHSAAVLFTSIGAMNLAYSTYGSDTASGYSQATEEDETTDIYRKGGNTIIEKS